MTNLETIDPSALATTIGGASAPTQQYPDDEPQSRTWGQVAGEYTNACIQGAGQSLMFGGRPRNWRDAALTAAAGCGMGVGMKAIEDVGNLVTGQR
jgi:hypothetical protein